MRTIVALCAAAIIAILASAAVLARQESAAAPTTVKDVMITMTIPASDVIFALASDPPKDDAQWGALRKASLTLADSGRLLMAPTLTKDSATWMEMARDLVNQAEATLKIAEAKNSAALEDAGDKVYATCEACHARYMEPTHHPCHTTRRK